MKIKTTIAKWLGIKPQTVTVPTDGTMGLNEYQVKAMRTCMPTSENITYMLLNLMGEVGEFSSKVAKHVRKGKMTISWCNLKWKKMTAQEVRHHEAELKKEAGDILWQLSGLCQVMGWRLEDVAELNLDKLADRQERDQIDGEGDNR